MNETLKALYDSFYQPLDLTAEKQEIKDCHQQLIERLDKPERKLVLRIIDAKDRSTELLSIDSFICGFKLALQFSAALRLYEETPLDRSKTFDASVVSSMFGENH